MGAHMYADRCAWREIGLCLIYLYLFAGPAGELEPEESRSGPGGGGRMRGDWLPARVLFSLRENVVGSFFFSLLVGLDAPPPFF